MRNFILCKGVKIEKASAASSPISIGFPPITAWVGASHAIERNLDMGLKVLGVAIACVNFKVHKFEGEYENSLMHYGTPLKSNGERDSFIEEARCDTTVNLLFELSFISEEKRPAVVAAFKNLLLRQKLASGDVLAVERVDFLRYDEETPSKLINKLMLGYVIKPRLDLLSSEDSMNDVITAMVLKKENKDERARRNQDGWIIPICVGYSALSELKTGVKNARSDTPHRFAEAITALAEFVLPTKVSDIDDILWKYKVNGDLYLCDTN